MALSHIREVRRAGGKPAIVTVIVGDKPDWLDDGPTVVNVPAKAPLSALDWLPLVGVWVTVHWLSGSAERALAVIDCLERTGAKLFGASGPFGVHSLTSEPTTFERNAIKREWEALCTA